MNLKNRKYNQLVRAIIMVVSIIFILAPFVIVTVTDNLWLAGLSILPCVLQCMFIAVPVCDALEEYYIANSKRGLIHESDIYSLFEENGTAKLHVGDIDTLPRYNVYIPETYVTLRPEKGFWIQDSAIWQETGEPVSRYFPVCDNCGRNIGAASMEDDTFRHCPGCGKRIIGSKGVGKENTNA